MEKVIVSTTREITALELRLKESLLMAEPLYMASSPLFT